MNYPKISIVTPSFNQGKYIEQTILSVLEQKYPNLEYIIIDGGSTDETCEIIKKYEKFLTYWISEADNGQTDAINKGFSLVSGDVVNWLNADDILLPNALNIISNEFMKHPEISALCGKEYAFKNDSKIPYVQHIGSLVYQSTERTFYEGIIDQPCTFFKKSSIEKYFPLTYSLRYVMDRELWLSYLCEHGIKEIKCIDSQLTAFRLHDNSKTVSQGHLFECEFASIKVNILSCLNAPEKLVDFMKQKSQNYLYESDRFLRLNWNQINKNRLLKYYAYEFAIYSYVKNDLITANFMMRLIARLDGIQFTILPLYFKVVILPLPFLKIVKKAKQLF